MQDFSNEDYRKHILDEILGKENQLRKMESFKRSEIVNKRAAPFIIQAINKEFPDSADEMRKITSINPAKRMIDNMASIYKTAPERAPVGLNGKALSQDQVDFIEDTYELGKWNTLLQRANRVKKYQNQAQLQVLPLRGMISGRVYQPHQIDIVPLESDPEVMFGYVTSAYDKSNSLIEGDGRDQKIADANDADAKKRAEMRFVWWSAEHNLITDGNGVQVSDESGDMEIVNPLGRLNLIDISDEKDNEFWVRKGSSVCDFTIDLGVLLSDTANTNRLQGFGQPVIVSKENPGKIKFGPTSAIHIPLADDGPQPDIKFITPGGDLDASMRLITTLMNLFASSEGQSPKLISTTGEAEKYASGLDRFLAQIEAFEASKEDLEQFRSVEQEVFELILAWANLYAGASNSPLKIKAPSFSEESYLQVQFSEPQLMQTQKEKEESAYMKVEKGVYSLVMAVQDIFGYDEEQAIEHLKKVREQQADLTEEGESNPPEETKTEEVTNEEPDLLDLTGGEAEEVEGEEPEATEGDAA